MKEVFSPEDMPVALSVEIHSHFGAWSCLRFEGQTGTVRNQPGAGNKSSTGGQERGV